MKLNLTLTDTRVKGSAYFRNEECEDYERSAVDSSGSARFIANVLRSLADEIDPPSAYEQLPEWERRLLSEGL